mmetsp:Transcript_24368/g.17152  ORF Transcript_24368/g.17152 Transcript_24368/m.17152 type:complete len:142 (-) Transcript_24368:64-489(-)
MASYYGHSVIVKWILKKCKERNINNQINRKSKDGQTALFGACFRGYPSNVGEDDKTEQDKNRASVVKVLLDYKPNVNFVISDIKMTPLHWACFHDDLETIELLLEKEADLKLNYMDNTPLDIAGYCGNINTIELFLDTFVR